MARILVTLQPNRDKVGKLEVFNNANQVVLTMNALGRADRTKASKKGNPDANPLYEFGDTPIGKYETLPNVLPPPTLVEPAVKSYGLYGKIALLPVSGDALTAKNNGRTGLLIHGGDPGTAGQLRSTNGCVRVSNPDLKLLVDKFNALKAAGDSIKSIEVTEKVLLNMLDADVTTPCDDPEPPVLA